MEACVPLCRPAPVQIRHARSGPEIQEERVFEKFSPIRDIGNLDGVVDIANDGQAVRRGKNDISRKPPLVAARHYRDKFESPGGLMLLNVGSGNGERG